MAYGDGARGIGGWLAFFLVTLGLFTPGGAILSVTMVRSDLQSAGILDAFPSLIPSLWALAAVTIALCWFATYRFLKVFTPATIYIGIGVLAAITLMSVIVEPMVAAAVTGVPLREFYRGAPEIIRPFIYCGVWTAYLLRSKRVHDTYRDAQGEETAGVFA